MRSKVVYLQNQVQINDEKTKECDELLYEAYTLPFCDDFRSD